MKIVITDYYSGSNRGDAAILEGVIESIRKQVDDAEYRVITENKQAAQLINGIDAYEQQISPQQWKKYWKSGNSTDVLDTRQRQLYQDADLIVSTGGHHLTDTYFPAKMGMLLELYYCSRMSAPVVLFSQTIGPLQREPYRSLTRLILNRINLVTVRDEKSHDVLKKLNLSNTQTYFTADAAFAMPHEPPRELPITLRGGEAVPIVNETKAPVVTISVRQVGEFYSKKKQREYIHSISELADYLIDKQNAKVVFISTCTSIAGYEKDDRLIAHKVVDRINRSNVSILHGEYSPYELVDIYAQADLHVGTRMHSCILAAKAGTPIVGIEYQFKVAELLNQFGMQEYGIDVSNISPQPLIDIVNKAFRNKDQLEQLINEKTKQASREAERTGKLASELIDK